MFPVDDDEHAGTESVGFGGWLRNFFCNSSLLITHVYIHGSESTPLRTVPYLGQVNNVYCFSLLT